MVEGASCVGSVGKWLVGGGNVSGASSWGWLFGSWSCWARPASAGACKPNHLALQIGEGCLMTHISRNKYEGEGPSIWGVGCRSGRARSPGSRRERREKSHRNKAAPLQQRRRRGPINWDPWAAMPATSQGKTPRLRSVAAVLHLASMRGPQ